MNIKRSTMWIGIIIGLLAICAAAIVIFINQPSFGQLPHGERLERIKRSPQYRDGQFQNEHSTPLMTSGKGRLRTMLGFLCEKSTNVYPSQPVAAIKTDLKHLPANDLIVWFGHSSYLLQLSGHTILVDPVFHTASPVPFINKPFEGTDIYHPDDMPPIDYLVITHDHWDHLDYKTVKQLRSSVRKVVCPLGVGAHFERWEYAPTAIIELDWHEHADLDTDISIHCLPARHFSGRGLRQNQSLWASFLLRTPSNNVYIGGDSGYDTHFAQIGQTFPNIDLAILENGQYNKNWRYIHTLPEYLGKAATDLRAKRIMTLHHSKFALSKHPWDEPLRNERAIATDFSLELIIPKIGEMTRIDRSKK